MQELTGLNDTYHFIALDFDGCVCENAFPEIGNLREEVLDKLRRRMVKCNKLGKIPVVILWTCRADIPERNYLSEAIDFCMENNVPIQFVNENPLMDFGHPECVKKIYADEYWDDKAVAIKEK
jgi:hypothetical protein